MFLLLLTLVLGLFHSAFAEPLAPHSTLALTSSSSHCLVLGKAAEGGLKALTENLLTTLTLPLPSIGEAGEGTCCFHNARNAWIHYFSNKLVQDRIQERLVDTISCVLFPTSGNEPVSTCVMMSENEEIDTLEASLEEFSYLRLFGVSEWDLLQAKEETWHSLVCKEASSAMTASAMQSISAHDIDSFLHPLFVTLDQELNLTESDDTLEETSPFHIVRCSQEDEYAPFYSLYISQTDKHYIYEVMHTIAKSNVIKLGLNKKSITKKGEKIRHVHPLRFLSYVMGEGGLRNDMRKIRKSKFKWNGFFGDFSKRLNREADQNNLIRYVPGFAQSLGVDRAQIQSIIERRDWHGLINYFL